MQSVRCRALPCRGVVLTLSWQLAKWSMALQLALSLPFVFTASSAFATETPHAGSNMPPSLGGEQRRTWGAALEETFRACIERLGSSDSYIQGHGPRYRQTFSFLLTSFSSRLLNSTLADGVPLRVLDLGGGGVVLEKAKSVSAFPICLKEAFASFRSVQLEFYKKDLRRPLRRIPSRRYHLVLCLETIEHVADLAPAEQEDGDAAGFPDAFWKHGMRSMLLEIRRVLTRDGMVLLSTPNFASLRSMARAMKHEAPMVDNMHVRELTVQELGYLLLTTGLAGRTFVQDSEPWGGGDTNLEATLKDFLDSISQVTRNPAFSALRGTNIMIATGLSRQRSRQELFGSDGFWHMMLAHTQSKRRSLAVWGTTSS
eukprot:TRINITY_DN57645_c0_g1_i1.p1 TRINITY_DN57645_c0_g1~~TRINITY_DN57645_c0_g1_i1.p1  ORF type:complete len:380 (-),score=38.56 TRINITY_DN57645_c0_g1_i1:24-1136(-)